MDQLKIRVCFRLIKRVSPSLTRLDMWRAWQKGEAIGESTDVQVRGNRGQIGKLRALTDAETHAQTA